jgi:radical SAM superfamily enzyme with C-terminal helix-hairpin-helix motif
MCAKYIIYFTKFVQNTFVKLIFTIYCVQNTKYNKINRTRKNDVETIKIFFKFKILFFVCKITMPGKKNFFCVQKTI